MDTYFTPEQLADAVRRLRREQKLTQAQVASRLVESGRYESLSPQAVSQAENYKEGDGLTNLRVQIVEELSGKTLIGPVFLFEE